MKGLLVAILLVLLAMAFPILWPFVILALLFGGARVILGGVLKTAGDTVDAVKKTDWRSLGKAIEDEVDFWKNVWKANPTKKKREEENKEE